MPAGGRGRGRGRGGKRRSPAEARADEDLGRHLLAARAERRVAAKRWQLWSLQWNAGGQAKQVPDSNRKFEPPRIPDQARAGAAVGEGRSFGGGAEGVGRPGWLGVGRGAATLDDGMGVVMGDGWRWFSSQLRTAEAAEACDERAVYVPARVLS